MSSSEQGASPDVSGKGCLIVGLVLMIFFAPFICNSYAPESWWVDILFRNYRALLFYVVAYSMLWAGVRYSDRKSKKASD